MSGHSKWSTIKHKKAKEDAKRGKVFTKLIKEITVAARMGGGDIDGNPRLRAAVTAAKQANMPMQNIDRAIKKGSGELEGVSYEEVTYEGYGPEGVPVLVDALTDNRNRTSMEIRHLFSKHSGSLGAPGSVAWRFELRGVIEVLGDGVEEDQLLEAALEAGAEDVKAGGETFEVYTAPDAVEDVRAALEKGGYKIESAEAAKVAKGDPVKLEGKSAERMLRLMDSLEDNDDVKSVWSSFDVDDDVIEAMS